MITSLDDMLNPKSCPHKRILFGRCQDCKEDVKESYEEIINKMKKDPWDTEEK